MWTCLKKRWACQCMRIYMYAKYICQWPNNRAGTWELQSKQYRSDQSGMISLMPTFEILVLVLCCPKTVTYKSFMESKLLDSWSQSSLVSVMRNYCNFMGGVGFQIARLIWLGALFGVCSWVLGSLLFCGLKGELLFFLQILVNAVP